MKKLFETLCSLLQSGQDAVLVSIVASSGSTPRGSGAHMLVTDAGRVYGTIGGGAVEYKAESVAAEALKNRESVIREFILRKNEVEDLGMVCGGDVTVCFRYLSHEDGGVLETVRAALRLFEAGEESWLILGLDARALEFAVCGVESGLSGADALSDKIDELTRDPGLLEIAGRKYYTEPLARAGRVYIFGGGHVAQALVPALTAVQFRCVVLEDREAFCRPELFPGVEETRLISLDRIADAVQITPADYVCIMTRGHKDDMTVQAFAMGTPARYIGVIGSRRKIASVTARIKADYGYQDADFARITTPIGLDIGAETPAEIAVSITAQLIAVRAGQV